MKIFIDTEFTDFIDTDLISIGMVADDDRQFYGERSDFDRTTCSAFVREAVLPQLGKVQDCVYTWEGLGAAVQRWLDQFAGTRVEICFDFDGDWTLLCALLNNQIPEWIIPRNIFYLIDDLKFEAYIARRFNGMQHHALHDAIANKFACGDEK